MNSAAGDSRPGRLRTLLARLVMPADDWAHRGERRTSTLLLIMLALLCILVATGVVGVELASPRGASGGWLPAFLVLLGLAVAIVLVLMHQVQRHLLAPLTHLYTWALSMCDGDLSARIPSPQKGQFAKLTFHINRLSEALDRLANEMDDMVWDQTERLQQKNQSLELLYEIAAAVNTSDPLEHLLERTAEKLLPSVDGHAAFVHLCADDDELQLVTCVGSGSEAALKDKATVRARELFGSTSNQIDFVDTYSDGDRASLVTVPLRYREHSLGMLSMYTSKAGVSEDGEVRRLLLSVGKHLGMAIAKSRLDEESRNLALMRERTSLAYELHDSLAQTIAALRFQLRNLQQTLDGEELPGAKRELRRIESSFEEAHTEVRELIANFRAPIDERGLLPALEDMVSRFRNDTGITTYFQAECPSLRLTAASEMQVLGIVREALANVRKHSHAKVVRILMRCEREGCYRFLVEDDGVGIGEPVLDSHPGEHIGLAIMGDRARRLGGELKIDSEPDEGTRVELIFQIAAGSDQKEVEASVG